MNVTENINIKIFSKLVSYLKVNWLDIVHKGNKSIKVLTKVEIETYIQVSNEKFLLMDVIHVLYEGVLILLIMMVFFRSFRAFSKIFLTQTYQRKVSKCFISKINQ